MSERMKKSDRHNQLLGIMNTLREQATCQADFTAEKIAEVAGGISAAWVYELVGAEFKVLRSQLDGPRHSSEGTERKLREEIHELLRRLKEMEAKYKADIAGDFSAAVRHIEAQDERIRFLEGLVRLLEERLKKVGQIMDVPQQGVTSSEKSFEVLKNSSNEGDVAEVLDVIDADNNYSN